MEESRTPQQQSAQPSQALAAIIAKLGETVAYRGGQASTDWLRLMGTRLSKEPFNPTMKALTFLGECEIERGETLIPSLGDILHYVRYYTPFKSPGQIAHETQIREHVANGEMDAKVLEAFDGPDNLLKCGQEPTEGMD